MFAALPEAGQKFLLRRHRELEADYTQKTMALAGLRDFEPVAELSAHASDLKVLGADTFALGSADGGVLLVREGRVQTLAAKCGWAPEKHSSPRREASCGRCRCAAAAVLRS